MKFYQLEYFFICIILQPDCGIVEMVKNSVTLDSLKRYLSENQENFSGGINNFFSNFYGENAD